MTTPVSNQAAREAHDKELEEMEKALMGGQPNPEEAAPETPETPAAETPAEEETPAPASAPGEENQPPVEQTPAPAPKATAPKASESEELTDEEVQQLSGKAQKRFGSLSKENIRLKTENEFLRKHMSKQDAGETPEVPEEPSTPPTRLPWDTTPPEEEEMTVDQIRLEARREAALQVAEERRQERIMTNLENDSRELETKFPEFDPKSESYDPTLVTKISVWYKAQFKENNDLRLKDFVTELMAIRAQGEARGRSEVDETIARQAADQAITPTAPTGKTSDTVVKKIQGAGSIEELESLEAQI